MIVMLLEEPQTNDSNATRKTTTFFVAIYSRSIPYFTGPNSFITIFAIYLLASILYTILIIRL